MSLLAMSSDIQFFPEQASTQSAHVDALYMYLIFWTSFFSLLIAGLILTFIIKYRRRSDLDRPLPIDASVPLEIVWTVIPLVISLSMFTWGARLYYSYGEPPVDAMEIHVLGKQWMWKIQHSNGRREINELHVPRDRPIKLTMISQDVIHDFSIPAFRTKQDVLPGRYVTEWFTPIKTGEYHIFCAEYCGTLHSGMIGRIVVMEPDQFAAWLNGTPPAETPTQAGEQLFRRYGCINCHGTKAPTLANLYGSTVKLTTGETVLADESYIRESILDSTAKVVEGFQPIMPSFRGQLNEEQLMQLIAYIKSLSGPERREAGH